MPSAIVDGRVRPVDSKKRDDISTRIVANRTGDADEERVALNATFEEALVAVEFGQGNEVNAAIEALMKIADRLDTEGLWDTLEVLSVAALRTTNRIDVRVEAINSLSEVHEKIKCSLGSGPAKEGDVQRMERAEGKMSDALILLYSCEEPYIQGAARRALTTIDSPVLTEKLARGLDGENLEDSTTEDLLDGATSVGKQVVTELEKETGFEGLDPELAREMLLYNYLNDD